MPVAQDVGLSDDSGESGPEPAGPAAGPPPKRRRLGPTVSVKQKLSSEVHLRILTGSKCTSCKSRCMAAFQAPFLFHQLLQFRSCWGSTSKLDQDIIVSSAAGVCCLEQWVCVCPANFLFRFVSKTNRHKSPMQCFSHK